MAFWPQRRMGSAHMELRAMPMASEWEGTSPREEVVHSKCLAMVSPMPAHRYFTGASAIICGSMKMWLGGILEKEYSRRLPSGWYKMPRLVQPAQVEAMVLSLIHI